jgi:hypothetical protein
MSETLSGTPSTSVAPLLSTAPKSAPRVGFVSLGCPSDIRYIPAL